MDSRFPGRGVEKWHRTLIRIGAPLLVAGIALGIAAVTPLVRAVISQYKATHAAILLPPYVGLAIWAGVAATAPLFVVCTWFVAHRIAWRNGELWALCCAPVALFVLVNYLATWVNSARGMEQLLFLLAAWWAFGMPIAGALVLIVRWIRGPSPLFAAWEDLRKRMLPLLWAIAAILMVLPPALCPPEDPIATMLAFVWTGLVLVSIQHDDSSSMAIPHWFYLVYVIAATFTAPVQLVSFCVGAIAH